MEPKRGEGQKVKRVDRWEDDLAISMMIEEGNPNNSEPEFDPPRWVELEDGEVQDSGQ